MENSCRFVFKITLTVLTPPRMQNVHFPLTCVAQNGFIVNFFRDTSPAFCSLEPRSGIDFFADLSLENNGSGEK